MFGFLKDKLKKSVSRLADKMREKPEEKPEPKREKGAEKKPIKKLEKPAKPKPAKPEIKPEIKKPTKPARVRPRIAEKAKEKPEPEPMPEPEPEPSAEGLKGEKGEQEEPATMEEVVQEVAEEGGKAIETEEMSEKVAEEKPVEPGKRPGFMEKLRGIRDIRGIKEAVVEKTLTEKDIDSFFNETETDLLQANVALEAIDYMRGHLKRQLAERKIKRGGAEQFITKALEGSLLSLVNQGSISLEQTISDAKKQGRPACLVFLGVNGGGKTTSIGKCARYLMDRGYSVALAAGDTFRAASIEQLEHHGEKLGVKVVKHKYGSDSAAVIFDARKHAESRGIDVVLADTAGRMHTDKNLADELRKVIRVNQPDLKILVLDSLTGNDAVEQAKMFHEMAGVDAVIMAKTDVNEKGGSILSVSYAIKKPILFLGTGQGYKDLEPFDPARFVKGLME